MVRNGALVGGAVFMVLLFGHVLRRVQQGSVAPSRPGEPRPGELRPVVFSQRPPTRSGPRVQAQLALALGPIQPTDAVPGLFWFPSSPTEKKTVYVMEIVANELTNRTTIIAFMQDAFTGSGNDECQQDTIAPAINETTFKVEEMAQEGVGPVLSNVAGGAWLNPAYGGHDCTVVPTTTFDNNINFCVQITHCKGTHYGATRGSLRSLADRPAAGQLPPGSRGSAVALAGFRTIRPDAMPKVIETVHYYEFAGYKHVYIGVNGLPGCQTQRDLEGNLSQFVASGFASVHPCGNGDILQKKAKLPFLNAVLYHAKGRYDWLGVWDPDEVMVPRASAGTVNVDTVMKGLVGERQVDSADPPCFVIFKATSFTIPENPEGTYNGNIFPRRLEEFGGKAAYEKSMVNPNVAMYTGLHYPGSCSLDQWTTTGLKPRIPQDFVKVENQSVAGMNHYVNMFGGRYGNPRDAARVPDEYATYFYPLLKFLDRTLIGKFALAVRRR